MTSHGFLSRFPPLPFFHYRIVQSQAVAVLAVPVPVSTSPTVQYRAITIFAITERVYLENPYSK